MGDRAWAVPQDQFVAAWNGATSIEDAVRRMKELIGGAVPRWAVMARAVAVRKSGTELKPLPVADTQGHAPATDGPGGVAAR